jgi:hypothetical protein
VNTRVAEDDVGGGWTAWVGATIFEFGAICGLWEAWNRGDTADFGWGVKMLLEGEPAPNTSESSSPGSEKANSPPKKKWIWFSADRKYFHELGFLAAFVQYWAATIFWISG